MNILKLVFANIRKRKGAVITFLVMVILAALMLSISLSLMIGGSNFYDKKVDELNAPHYSDFIVSDKYKDDFRIYAENYKGVTDVSVITNTLWTTGTWKMGSITETGSAVFLDHAEVNEKSFYKPRILDELNTKPANMIFMSVSVRSSGIKSGDTIMLEVGGKSYDFTVCGFYEDAVFGASTIGAKLCYVSAENFSSLKPDGNYSTFTGLFMRFEKSEMQRDFQTDFRKQTKLNNNEEFIANFETSKTASMTFVNMATMILIMFSLIILLIAIIVVDFSIKSSIAEDITTIGALKGIGYKNKALKGAQLIQYLLIALTGGLVGSVISLFTFGFLGNIIASTSGLLWLSGANILPVLVTIAVICGLTTFITLFATRKYKKITPINALRQGDSHHSFKKNVMPLEKHSMSLNLHLGAKRFLGSIKNSTILCIVVALLVLVSAVVNSMSYNLNSDRTAMVQMVGLETANVWVMSNSNEDMDIINEEIKSDTDVSRTLLVTIKSCFVDGFYIQAEAVEDYSKLTINTIVKGSYPSLKNEVVLGATTARTIGKGVGDTVELEIDDARLSYVVVGISQNIGNNGEGCNITFEAMRNHNEQIVPDTIYIYLNDGIDTKAYESKLKATYGDRIVTIDTDEQMDTILSSLGNPLSAITVVMIIVTVIVIAFVLFLIISALIRKQKKELGIMKAIGYKNRHLILQLLISFLPPLVLGTLIGTILTFIVTNPLLSVFFTSMGILKANFIIPVLPTILISLGIFVVSVGAAYLISARLRKISPQKLIVE